MLLTKDTTAKISDVGLSKIMKGTRTAATQAGSLRWASPEQLFAQQVTLSSDIWSLAMTIFDLCSYQGESLHGRETRRLLVPSEAPQGVQDLIFDCLVEDAESRPSAAEFYSRLNSA